MEGHELMTNDDAQHAQMLRRLHAHYDALVRAGHTVHLDPEADNCLHVETSVPGTTIDVDVVNLRDPQEESDVWLTTGRGTGQVETVGVGQIRDHFVTVLVDGLVRFVKGQETTS